PRPAVLREPEPVATDAANTKPDGEPTPAPAATPIGCAVRGTVVDDATGEPVAGADVWVLPPRNIYGNLDDAARIVGDALKDPELALDRYKPAAIVTTAGDGVFECDKLSTFSDWMAIAFDSSGRCAASRAIQFDEARSTHDVELRLISTFVLKGVVTDSD